MSSTQMQTITLPVDPVSVGIALAAAGALVFIILAGYVVSFVLLKKLAFRVERSAAPNDILAEGPVTRDFDPSYEYAVIDEHGLRYVPYGSDGSLEVSRPAGSTLKKRPYPKSWER